MTDRDAHEDGSAKQTLDAFEIGKLLEVLPHRYPFLMIDRIVDIDGYAFGAGIKNITVNEPQFQGHFPDMPVMPGVLMLEGMAQTAGALCLNYLAESGQMASAIRVYLMSIDKARFRKPVVPGDVVRYEVTRKRTRGMVFKYDCVALVGADKVAEAEVTAMVGEYEAA